MSRCMTCCMIDNPKMDAGKLDPSQLPPGGMLALAMDPANRPLVEAAYAGLEPSPVTPLSSSYLEGDVSYPSGGHGLISTTHDCAAAPPAHPPLLRSSLMHTYSVVMGRPRHALIPYGCG
jgi:hypothetical protein